MIRLLLFVSAVGLLLQGTPLGSRASDQPVPRPPEESRASVLNPETLAFQGMLPGKPAGSESSTVRISNLSDTGEADVMINFYSSEGSVAGSGPGIVTLEPGVEPRSAFFLSATDVSTLPSPFSGGSVVGASQPLGTVHLKEVSRSFDARLGMVMADPVGFKRQYVPFMIKGLRLTGFSTALSSRLFIQNASADQIACVWIAYWNTADIRVFNDGLNASSPGCPTRGLEIPPMGQLERELSSVPQLGSSFLGSAMVVVEKNSSGIQAPVATAIDVWDGRRFGSVEGAGLESSANEQDGVDTTLYFPTVTKLWGGRWTSHVMLQNTSFTRDFLVRLTFRGNGLPGGVSTVRYLLQRNRWLDLSQLPDSILPDNFIGNLTVEALASQPIAAAVLTTYSYQPGSHRLPLLAYRAVPADSTTDEVALPLVYRNRDGTTSTNGWNTRLAIMTTDGFIDSVEIQTIPESCCSAQSGQLDMPSTGQPLYALATSWWLTEGFVGTGRVRSLGGKDIAVVAITENNALTGDTWAAHPAFPH